MIPRIRNSVGQFLGDTAKVLAVVIGAAFAFYVIGWCLGWVAVGFRAVAG